MITEFLSACKNCNLRRFSAKASKKIEKGYKETLLLPSSDFPQWVGSSKRVLRDEEILQKCGFSKLYALQRERTAEEFVLHDGPPYANGIPHMGHAVNKVLKDVVSRWQLLSGKKVHFKPGWDCHGLPIELKAIAGHRKKLSPLDVRLKAKLYAEEAVKNQKVVFKSWGVMADWDGLDGCYHTFDPAYVTNQLEQFYLLYNQGFIFRDLKPVYWSPSSRTALAESELEYNAEHVSTAVTLKLKIHRVPFEYNGPRPVYALIWTTTPWTLPMNQAVAFNAQLNYAIVKCEKECFLVASETLSSLKSKLESDFEVLINLQGKQLEGITYEHPLTKETLPFLSGSHVTSDMGTGLVHVAPAHGPDDYIIGLNNNLTLKCLVDESGKYTEEVGSGLGGLSVLNDGQSKVLEIVQNSIVHRESITHAYPYDWRSKGPVIFRASLQWFIDTDRVKQKALDVLDKIRIFPSRNIGGLVAQLQRRPYWCISRQRSWGVPIPSLYEEGKPIIERDLIENYKKLVAMKGIDFWWTLPVQELVPESLKSKLNVQSLTKSEDIMDIWLDSGLSWSAILDGKTADLCVEGIDQFTGWFQSSLLTSVALKDQAPYKSLLVHGFVVDDNGRKMSKSLGNVVDPIEIVKGGTDSRNKPPFGVDVLRWWVSAHATQHSNIPVSNRVLNESSDAVRKLRNSLRFMLGSIKDFPEENLKADFELSAIDEYILYCLDDLHANVSLMYASYEFNKVCRTLLNFISNQFSSFYAHLSKERLYCHKVDSIERRNIQLVMYYTLSSLLKILGPITPVLVEEAFLYHPHNSKKTPYFVEPLPLFDVKTLKSSKEKVNRIVSSVYDLRDIVVKECPVNLSPGELHCEIFADPVALAEIKALQSDEESCFSDLVNALKVSSIDLKPTQEHNGLSVRVRLTDYHLCTRCRRHSAAVANELCLKCSTALNS